MNNSNSRAVHLSVVSHGQSALIAHLLQDIERCCDNVPVHVSVTLNIPEPLYFDPDRFRFPINILRNVTPNGFAANHNAAFRHGQLEYPCGFFSVVNPDIRFSTDPFPGLLRCLNGGRPGVAAPLVLNSQGGVEDSVRRFPTPLRILAKALGRDRRPDYAVDCGTVSGDWVAGMFMLMPTEVFQLVGGFDERYFLYYEDVDLCARMRIAGFDVRLCPNVRVVHEARRQSHRDVKYLRWHLASMARFFFSPVYRSIVWRRFADRICRDA